MIDFTSIQQMLEDTAHSSLPLWDNIRRSDCRAQGITPEQSWEKMSLMLETMKASDRDYREEDRSHSGLVGGDGGKMARYAQGEKTLCGPFLSQVMAGALRMGECNACMKRIVAAPTAGACGVLPAVLLPYEKQFGATHDQLVEALYVASGFGMIIAARASISVKRNVIGAMDALSAAQMALAGIESRVPPDQVLDAMAEVGRSLPHTLRETGKGGLAATPFGQQYMHKEA